MRQKIDSLIAENQTRIEQIDQKLDNLREAGVEVNDGSNRVEVGGANKVVDMPEFKKVDIAKDFLNVLDAKDLVVDVLNTGVADNINVYIGEETAKDELKNFSIVTFDHLLEDKDIGTIGIIGPTRMDYSKVIAVMKYISKKLNDDYKKGKF